MTQDDDTNELNQEPNTSDTIADTGDPFGDSETIATQSRRRFLLTAGAVGIGGLALGASDSASAGTTEEVCNSEDYGSIEVADGFMLVDNQWGNADADQCVWLNNDGSYGYDFDGSGGDGINYPEVICGTKPWGTDTEVAEFPMRRQDVEELVIDVEAEYSESGGEWDFAEEWWLMEQPPSQETGTHVYEIMLLLDWSDQHSHGAVEAENAWTDRFGNTVDHWTTYATGGTNATFYIFRIQGGHDGGRIDLAEVVEYLTDEHGIDESLWLSGIELGNEYWRGSVGETTYNTFDVTVNGKTYESGSSDDSDDNTGDDSDDNTGDDSDDNTGDDSDDNTGDDSDDNTGDEYPEWDPDAVYRAGDQVVHNGRVWEAQWYTQDQEPHEEEYYVWQPVEEESQSDDEGSGDDTGGDDGDDSDSDTGNDSDGDDTGGNDSEDSNSGGNASQLIAEMDPSTTSASVGDRITFSVTDTSGSSNWIDSLEFAFDDGETATGWWAAHTYDSAGTYTVALTATNNEGNSTTHEVDITVS